MYHGERFNGYTHLAGAVMALGASTVLVALGAQRADLWRIVSFTIYGTTLVALFGISTLYHSTRGRAKDIFRKLDHVAIYLLIAGSYTPIALVTLQHDPWGWTLFVAVWALAVLGILQELWVARGLRLTSLAIYLLMGWLGIVAIEPLMAGLGNGFAWMLAAGLVYTAGIVFYIYDERFTHWHGIWHCFVIAGSALHFAAIVRFVA